MEVVAAAPNSNGVPPFHNHDVREWSRIDSLTGVLERARLETDHWAANTSTSSHKYGKVVDSRARSNADGAVQQRARRQLEVFQSTVPGGHLQVIKSHTVSSSRWTSKSSTVGEHKDIAQHFGDLELSLNPLDLSSQKSKATVGRSVGRRPPSRPRARDEPSSIGRHTIPLSNIHSAAAANLHRVSRLCHQIHENAVKQTFGKYHHKPPIHERESGDGVEIVEIESVTSDNEKPKPVNGHAKLTRTKSTSSEDLHLLTPEKDKPNKSIEDLEDLEQLQNWRRTSKIRRSLQFPKQNKASAVPKPLDLPENTGSVRKLREDLETGRRLSTALRGNNVDLEALDQILQSISTSSSGSDKNSSNGDKYEQPEKDAQVSLKKQKRNSFVTVESLQEVRGRLRPTSSPTEDIYQIKSETNDLPQRGKKEEEADDGIVTEEHNSKQFEEMPVSDNLAAQSRVRSYVYGMEAMINKKPMLGTGSLECRSSKQFNGTSGYRNEDWYNRRKSYGFEQVHNHQEPINSISKNKGLMESSTDSGICRSSEIVLVPTANKGSVQLNKSSDYNSEIDSEKEDKYLFNKNNNKYDGQNGSVVLNVGSVKRYTSIFEQKKENSPVPTRKTHDNSNLWNHRTPMENIQDERLDRRSPRKDFEGTTITIPIVSQNFNKNNYQQQFNDHRFIDENAWESSHNHNGDIKRHSIAVDESKYVNRTPDNKYRRTSLAINDKINNDQFLQDGLEDDALSQKKQKKVEFCKTEVHFAAESGRVNIVATDEKPPPTNNFRRRRRNSAALYNQLLNDMNKNGLPVLHFGDSSYEKNLFGVTDQEDDPTHSNEFRTDANPYYDNKQLENDLVTTNTVTVSTNQSYQNYQHELEEEQKENFENEAPKGILKNKPIKPKPYLLGDENFFHNTQSENEENGIWGVKLKPVSNKTDAPMWRSTVTLKNTLYDRQQEKEYSPYENSYRDPPHEETRKNQEEPTQPEFQKLLRTLRPARKQEYDEEQRNSDSYDGIRIIPPAVDPRRSSWSVADMVKQVEDVQKSETKGYSTKVNIGGGEATVIEDMQREEKERHPTWPRRDDTLKDFSNSRVNKNSQQDDLDEFPTSNKRFLNESSRTWEKQQKQTMSNKTPHSPVVLRKTYNDPKKQDLRTAYDSEKLSSPFLVGQNVSKNEYESVKPRRTTELSSSLRRRKENHLEEKNTKVVQTSIPSRHGDRRSPTPTKEAPRNYSPARQKDKRSPSPTKRVSPKYSPTRQIEKRSPSPIKEVFRHYSPSRQKEKHHHQVSSNEENLAHNTSSTGRQKSPNRSVLRNPRKSEMTYFGVKASPSPKPVRKSTESADKKSWNNKPDLLQHYNTKEAVKYRKSTKVETKHEKASPERRSRERAESPIYENIDEIKRYKPKPGRKEFDSSILDELTKAADQILQAVNGYAEDAHKQSDEDKNRRTCRKEKLDTISETKSWKQGTTSKHKNSSQRSEAAKPKLKHTSSTSSVESIAEHRKSMTPVQRTTGDSDRHKKKTNAEPSSSRAATKARRLQRASSREALLQSHGSSSEDIPITIDVPVRKPRLVRKTKATQLTVTNVVEISKMPNSASRKREEKGKSEERVPVGALPEIRHKTAVSTIRSTAEKSANRDRTHRSRTEELKKKSLSKREASRVSSSSKSDRIRSISSKDPINHRISTANIKKCHKSEGSTRQ